MFLGSRRRRQKVRRRRSQPTRQRTTYAFYAARWRDNVNKSIKPATRKALDAAWVKWDTWVRLAQEELDVDIFKPSLEVYCSFIDVSLALYTPDTVKSYMKRINTAAREKSGFPVTRHLNKLWIKRTFDAAVQRLGHQGPKKRLPLTIDILASVHPFLNFENHNDRALWAILCVGVFTLARIGELVPGHSSQLKVTLGSVSIRGERGVLHLVGTKTDREKKGVDLLFFRNNTVCCPVTAMNAYLAARPEGGRDSPLFVDNNNERLTQSWVVSRLRELLDRAGFEGSHFSGISLRRGGAQTLIRLRANDKIVMGMGRWSSACFNRYLKVEERDVKLWQEEMARSIL